ncbi:MAG: hypothetical protein ACUZ8H_05575 [Candidatus Anammoxibacter sp.]
MNTNEFNLSNPKEKDYSLEDPENPEKQEQEQEYGFGLNEAPVKEMLKNMLENKDIIIRKCKRTIIDSAREFQSIEVTIEFTEKIDK